MSSELAQNVDLPGSSSRAPLTVVRDNGVVVSASEVVITNFKIEDPRVVDLFQEPNEDPVLMLRDLLIMGAGVYQLAHSAGYTEQLSRSAESFKQSMETERALAVADIKSAVNSFLDPNEAVSFSALIERAKKDWMAELTEKMDPEQRNSFTAKFERIFDEHVKKLETSAITALDPDNEASPIFKSQRRIESRLKEFSQDIDRKFDTVVASLNQASGRRAAREKSNAKGFDLEDIVQDAVFELAARFSDVAEDTSTIEGACGTKKGDVRVEAILAQNSGVISWECKTRNKPISLRSLLEEVEAGMANRQATVGVAVVDTAARPKEMTEDWQIFGEKCVIVIDRDDPDNNLIRLAYLWSRWMALRVAQDASSSLDLDKAQQLVAKAIQELKITTSIAREIGKASSSVDAASGHLGSLKTALTETLTQLELMLSGN